MTKSIFSTFCLTLLLLSISCQVAPDTMMSANSTSTTMTETPNSSSNSTNSTTTTDSNAAAAPAGAAPAPVVAAPAPAAAPPSSSDAANTTNATAPSANMTNDSSTMLPYPPTTLNLFLIEPYFLGDDVTNQVIAFLFCGINSAGSVLITCNIYDGRDPATSNLLGIEYLVNETTFNSLDSEEQRFWHSHVYGIQAGNVVAPDLTGATYNGTLAAASTAYGKAIFLWNNLQPLPTGNPSVAFAFSGPNQFNSTASAALDAATNTTAAQRADNNRGIAENVAAVAADSWDYTGQVPVFSNANVSLPANLWGLTFDSQPQQQ